MAGTSMRRVGESGIDLRELAHQIFYVVVAHGFVRIFEIGDDPLDHAQLESLPIPVLAVVFRFTRDLDSSKEGRA